LQFAAVEAGTGRRLAAGAARAPALTELTNKVS
jgi:hypothetical protein